MGGWGSQSPLFLSCPQEGGSWEGSGWHLGVELVGGPQAVVLLCCSLAQCPCPLCGSFMCELGVLWPAFGGVMKSAI